MTTDYATINANDYAPNVPTSELAARALRRYNDMERGANARREVYAQAAIDAISAIDSPDCDNFRAAVGTMDNVKLVDTVANVVYRVADGHLDDNELANLIARTFAAAVLTASRNI